MNVNLRAETGEFVLLTVTGRDRPGIVGEVSRWLFEKGGNIHESRMAQLGGEFAALLLVSGPAGFLAALEADRVRFEQESRLSLAARATSPSPEPPRIPLFRYTLEASCLDHPGVVYQVSERLRRRGINIAEAATVTEPAPFSGTPVFRMRMELQVPSNVAIAEFRAELEELGREQNIDFDLKACAD